MMTYWEVTNSFTLWIWGGLNIWATWESYSASALPWPGAAHGRVISRWFVSFSGLHSKDHTLGGLHNRHVLSHGPGGWQSAIKLRQPGFFWGLSPCLMDGWVFLCLQPFLINHIALGAPHDLLNLNHIFKDPASKCNPILRKWESGPQRMTFEGGHQLTLSSTTWINA